MSDLKGCIECSTTWENNDNRTFSDILLCTAIDDPTDPILQSSDSEDVTSGTSPSAKTSLRLRPFLHPEMTESKRCEVRVFVPPRLHRRIAKVVVRSSARNLEVYDRLGEYLYTVKGEHGEGSHSRWYTAVFFVQSDSFELVIKFLSLADENTLRLPLIHVFLVPHTWSGDLPSLGASHSLPSNSLNLERVHELTNFGESLSPSARQLLQLVEQQQKQPTNVTTANPRQMMSSHSLPATLLSTLLAGQHLRPLDEKRDSSDSTSSGDQQVAFSSGPDPSPPITRWLDDRLVAMESRIMSRLDAICDRISAVELAVSKQTER